MRHASRAAGAPAASEGPRARRPVFGPRRAAVGPSAAVGSFPPRLASPRALFQLLSRWYRCATGATMLLWLLLVLSRMHPGDQTLVTLSEGPLRLFISPAGISLRALHVPLRLHARADAQPAPRCPSSLNLSTAATAHPLLASCLAAVLDDSPTLLLSDAGTIHVLTLTDSQPGGHLGGLFRNLSCTHFTVVAPLASPHPTDPQALMTAMAYAAWTPSESLAIISSATSLEMLAPYHVTLRNHREYARSHGYACLLSLVGEHLLGGRSRKMAKHYALGTLTARGSFEMLIHLDMDAWFASWAPVSEVTLGWPFSKELLVPDAAQLWLNSGLLFVRGRSPWSAGFFQRVLDAKHDAAAGTGFKRDQPAVWSVLAEEWKASGHLPGYRGEECAAWRHGCNPDANPVSCWHACFWRPLTQGGPTWTWGGLSSLSTMPHLHVPKRRADARHPPLHKLCLASCPSALRRAPGLACAALLGKGAALCQPEEGVDGMSRCDGAGCARQLAERGGAWVKHSGHQHWKDVLPGCVPTSQEQARARLTAKTMTC